MRKWRGDPNGWTFDRYWIYDGDQRVISFDPSGSRIEEYAYAPGIDRPIATIRGASTIDAYGYHVQDELGNILGIIENGAYISQTLSYDAWGVPTETGHAYNNQLWWKSLKWEGDVISLYYVRNRWYDPETGRFMSEDPIGLAGGINQYTFANNDPVNGWDPYGLIPCSAAYEAMGYVTTMGSNGDDWCVAPATLPDVVIGEGGGSGVQPWTAWDNWTPQRPGGSGPTGPGGGGGTTGGLVGGDVGTHAEWVCRSTVLAATGTAILDFSGAAVLRSAWKAAAPAIRNARFNSRFHYPVPGAHAAAARRAAGAAGRAVGQVYVRGLAPGDGFGLAAESLIGEGHDVINYIPIVGVATANALRTIYRNCW